MKLNGAIKNALDNAKSDYMKCPDYEGYDVWRDFLALPGCRIAKKGCFYTDKLGRPSAELVFAFPDGCRQKAALVRTKSAGWQIFLQY